MLQENDNEATMIQLTETQQIYKARKTTLNKAMKITEKNEVLKIEIEENKLMARSEADKTKKKEKGHVMIALAFKLVNASLPSLNRVYGTPGLIMFEYLCTHFYRYMPVVINLYQSPSSILTCWQRSVAQ